MALKNVKFTNEKGNALVAVRNALKAQATAKVLESLADTFDGTIINEKGGFSVPRGRHNADCFPFRKGERETRQDGFPLKAFAYIFKTDISHFVSFPRALCASARIPLFHRGRYRG